MSVNSKMTAIADEIRELSGTAGTMGLDAMATHVGEANSEIDSQVELLAQAVAALEGKASGGSGDVELPELNNPAIASDLLVNKELIDENGNVVIGTMTDNGVITFTMDGIDVKSVTIPAGYTSGGTVGLDNTIDYETGVQADLLAQAITTLNNKVITTVCPLPLIDIDMLNNGVNIGSGGASYNGTVKNNGAFSDGKFITNGSGSLTIPTDFMNGTGSWTIAVAIDSWTASATAKFGRFMRGNKDVPSIFYSLNGGKNMFKLTNATIFKSDCLWYDMDFFTTNDGTDSTALVMDIANDEKTIIAFRNDGNNITMWVNGEAKIARKSSNYTSSYYASTFSIGDNANVGYSLTHLECSMLKAWNFALTDTEMSLIS